MCGPDANAAKPPPELRCLFAGRTTRMVVVIQGFPDPPEEFLPRGLPATTRKALFFLPFRLAFTALIVQRIFTILDIAQYALISVYMTGHPRVSYRVNATMPQWPLWRRSRRRKLLEFQNAPKP